MLCLCVSVEKIVHGGKLYNIAPHPIKRCYCAIPSNTDDWL